MATSDGRPREEGGDRRPAYRVRVLALGLIVLAVWAGLLYDPVVGPTLLRLAAGFVGVLGLLAVAVGLGWVGFGIFALGDRLRGWLRRASHWPEG